MSFLGIAFYHIIILLKINDWKIEFWVSIKKRMFGSWLTLPQEIVLIGRLRDYITVFTNQIISRDASDPLVLPQERLGILGLRHIKLSYHNF